MKVMVAGRGAGKTYDLISWVLDGEPRPNSKPFWSRALIVPLPYIRSAHLREHPRLWQQLQEKGGIPTRVILTVADVRRGALRGCYPDIEVALDNADTVLAEALGGRWPDLVAMDGEPLQPGVLSGRRSPPPRLRA